MGITGWIIIAIYLLGCPLAYKAIRKVDGFDDQEWNDVINSAMLSIFSWITFLVSLIYIDFDSKPPKWL